MTIKHRRRLFYLYAVLQSGALLAVAGNVRAGIGAGVRAGISGTPDQVVVGGQAMLGPVAPFIQLVPSVDFGFGDDASTTAINIDFRINLPSLPKVSPNLYIGAGPTIMLVRPNGEDRRTDIGFNAIAGVKIPMGLISHYNLEARLGVGDAPDIKVLFGILWGL